MNAERMWNAPSGLDTCNAVGLIRFIDRLVRIVVYHFVAKNGQAASIVVCVYVLHIAMALLLMHF